MNATLSELLEPASASLARTDVQMASKLGIDLEPLRWRLEDLRETLKTSPEHARSVQTSWMPERKPYSSDLTDEEYAILEPLLLLKTNCGMALGGRPLRYQRREILNGVRYVLRSGCAWRLMPHDLPSWRICYHHFREWRRDGTWARIDDQLRGVRVASGGLEHRSA